MMKLVKHKILIGLFLVGLSGFSQQKKWTLQACVNHALENNITVAQSENNLLIDEQDVIAAKGQFLPSARANVGHSVGIGTQRIDIGSNQIVIDRTTNVTNLGFGVSQTIFDGFRLTNLHKQSQLNLETSKLELARIKDDISLNVVNAYLNILFNQERLETAQAQLQFSEKQLNQVEELVDSGVQPKVNIYDAEATLSADEQNVTIAENNYNLALLTLSQLLQLPYDGFNVEIIEVDNPSEALLYNTISPILSYALENRNEIKVAAKNIENAQLGTEISKSGYYPTVSFNYNFGTNAFFTNITDMEESLLHQLDQQKAHSFGLNVGIPIFSRFQNKTAVAKSRIQEENAKLGLERAKLDLESNIQRAFTDAQAAFKAFEAAKKSLKSQKLAFENAQERYNIGVMNAFEIEQSRVRFINAESALINAKYDFVFKTKVLDFYMGKSLTN
ncbi:TolC family protein [Algibacter sp. 2305UL17-15]|uniref:TolC family protein n=1 Tax=Algibacter sp. 2305UL17-15 TaxID=3231268 RepID=UPI00345AB72C